MTGTTDKTRDRARRAADLRALGFHTDAIRHQVAAEEGRPEPFSRSTVEQYLAGADLPDYQPRARAQQAAWVRVQVAEEAFERRVPDWCAEAPAGSGWRSSTDATEQDPVSARLLAEVYRERIGFHAINPQHDDDDDPKALACRADELERRADELDIEALSTRLADTVSAAEAVTEDAFRRRRDVSRAELERLSEAVLDSELHLSSARQGACDESYTCACVKCDADRERRRIRVHRPARLPPPDADALSWRELETAELMAANVPVEFTGGTTSRLVDDGPDAAHAARLAELDAVPRRPPSDKRMCADMKRSGDRPLCGKSWKLRGVLELYVGKAPDLASYATYLLTTRAEPTRADSDSRTHQRRQDEFFRTRPQQSFVGVQPLPHV